MITLYMGTSLSRSMSVGDKCVSDGGKECPTTQILNTVGKSRTMESTSGPGAVNQKANANIPNRKGIVLVNRCNVAADRFGQRDLSSSTAQRVASANTRSMLSLSAFARRQTAGRATAL